MQFFVNFYCILLIFMMFMQFSVSFINYKLLRVAALRESNFLAFKVTQIPQCNPDKKNDL